MVDLLEVPIEDLLSAAGLPTDLNKIIRRTVRYRRRDGREGSYKVLGIEVYPRELRLQLNAPARIFDNDPQLLFSFISCNSEREWDAYFTDRSSSDDPEYLVSVTLI